MTRQQEHRIEKGFAIFSMVLIELVLLVSIWRTNWSQIIINLIFLLVMIDSFQLRKKVFGLKEVAIGMFNIINPMKELDDSDRAEFAIVEKNGQRVIDIKVTRTAGQEKVQAKEDR